MASKIETREERIISMHKNNPGRPLEFCAAVVDGIWDKKREAIVSKIPERFREASLADLGYMTKPIIDGLEEMFSEENKGTVGMIFVGPAGSGKTHAAFAVMNWLSERNPEALSFMSSYSQVVQSLRQEFNSGAYDDLGSVWDKLVDESGMNSYMLFLDDFLALKPTDFEIDKMTMVIDKRVNEFLPFLLTTNVPLDKFKDVFGERLASRLIGYCEIIEFEERDVRVENKL